jgi:micrococcal nuclease
MGGREFSANRTGGKIRRGVGRIASAFVAFGLLLGQASGLRAAEDVATCTALEVGPTRTVTRVIDGETLALDDGTELRLAGTLAPRAIDVGAVPGTWRLETAAIDALQAFVAGRSIEIRFGGERNDRYGRIKGHAFLRTDDEAAWVQGHLLKAGLARAYSLGGDRGCAGELLAAERTAREARLGVWAEAAYTVRAAEPSATLLRHLATFQLVEGRVVRVATTRGGMYLNFGGAGRRRGLSAWLKLGDRDRLGAFAANPKGLEGSLVRVRGWIAQRNGEPSIDLSAAGDLEVIAGGEAAGEPDSNPRAARRSRPK